MASLPAQVEAFSSLDDKKKKECGLLSNLYSIVIVIQKRGITRRRWMHSSLHTIRATFPIPSQRNGDCATQHDVRKKSLKDQFKGCIKAASGLISEDQFFKEQSFVFGSHSATSPTVTIHSESVFSKMWKVRFRSCEMKPFVLFDSSHPQTEAFYNLNVTLQKIKTKKRIADSIEELHNKQWKDSP